MPKAKKGARLPSSKAKTNNGFGANDESEMCSMDIDGKNVRASTSGSELIVEQDKRERREIRHRYRELISEAQKLSEENGDHDPQQHLDEANVLFYQVKMTREAALDSQFICLIAQLGKQKAQGLHTILHTFDPSIFAEKLITYLSGSLSKRSGRMDIPSESWELLGRAVSCAFKKAPIYKYMFGSFERGEVNLKPRQRQKAVKDKDLPTKAVVPREVPRGEKIEHETTTEEVERVLSILQELHKMQGNICFFEFVTNPYSFPQTIENIFHVAFLIKDGLAEITLDLDKLPVISPLNRSDGEAEPLSQKLKQVVLSITEQDWRNIIETFQISTPMIPPRNPEAETLSSKNKKTSISKNHRS